MVRALQLTDLTFTYAPGVPLIDGLTAHLSEGWTGVVGPNGSGKSTLLSLLTGALPAPAASLRRHPEEMVVHRCPQEVTDVTEAIETFSWAWDSDATRLRSRLGLDPVDLQRWPSLSPGERKRWQIAAALWREPDALLLDEPTNHLDADARRLLIEALREFSGVGLVVSHDRALLDELTTATLRLTGHGPGHLYTGCYAEARAVWEAEAQAQLDQLNALQDQRRAVRRRLATARRSRSAAEQKISAGSRIKGPRDSDARTMAAKNRVINGEARAARQVSLLRREVERLDGRLTDHAISASFGRDLILNDAPAPVRQLMRLNQEALRAGDKLLLRDVHLVVERDSRIWLRGPNGAGKTTLLNALLDANPLPPERLLVLPQDLPPEAAAQTMGDLHALPPDERGRVLQLVAALGVDPGKLLTSDSPSPGELRKLLIALALGRQVWAMLLDEPTNHLDLPSIEHLERALAAYGGALLVVSHDAHFARRCTDVAWRLEGQRVELESVA